MFEGIIEDGEERLPLHPIVISGRTIATEKNGKSDTTREIGLGHTATD